MPEPTNNKTLENSSDNHVSNREYVWDSKNVISHINFRKIKHLKPAIYHEIIPAEGRSFLVRQSQNAFGNHVSRLSEPPCVRSVSEFTLLGGRIWARIDRETSLVYLWTSPKKWCRMLESMWTVQNPQVKIRIFEKNPAKSWAHCSQSCGRRDLENL